MAQPPAVLIVARHGPRLDAADQQWHLSTPSPYDPPLTYGGWNQCRALGLRIANLLNAREQKLNTPGEGDGVSSHDFASVNSNGKRTANGESGEAKRKKRRMVKHKVVIHTSPFLRCLQTSAAIAAGLAQFSPTIETGSGSSSASRKAAGVNNGSSKNRSPNLMASASPRLRAVEGGGASPMLAPIPEPKHDLAHEVARKALQERKRYRRSKLRVDAFLGEWLNPGYFEDITPPPPSALMVKTAKAELMQNESVEVFTPMATSSGKTSGSSSLWSGGAKMQSLDEWSQIQESLPNAPSTKREGRSRASTVGSDSASPVESSGRKSPFRPGSALSPLTSTVPKPELSAYHPPTPQYAVSSSDHIPRGYVAHARNSCTNVDFQWDSSRPPQNWGDGGELGEEWSAMHKRFRKGLDCLVQWYSRHDADDRGEDALGIEQADRKGDNGVEHEDSEEEEELVVVMVTHGAGCNALIGAITNQPVLLDVGMASLTMAVRKDDAPPLLPSTTTAANGNSSHAQSPDPASAPRRRNSTDLGLASIYDLPLIASTEHLRPGSNFSARAASSTSSQRSNLSSVRDSLAQYKARLDSTSSSDATPFSSSFSYEQPSGTGKQSALLGSIRRPSAAPLSAPGSQMPSRMNSSYPGGGESPPVSQGLWTPPAGRTPVLRPVARPPPEEVTALNDGGEDQGGEKTGSGESDKAKNGDKKESGGGDTMVLEFSTSPPDSRPGTSSGHRSQSTGPDAASLNSSLNANNKSASPTSDADQLPELPPSGQQVPSALQRGLSQKGLWGARPSGDKVERSPMKDGKAPGPKRRWTVDDRD